MIIIEYQKILKGEKRLYDSSYEATMALLGGMFFTVFAIATIIIILQLVVMWKLFVKMGEDGWKALIPFYNTYVLCDKIFGNGLYMLGMFLSIIPVVGGILLLIYGIICNIRLAKSFGQDTPFIIGLVFVPLVFTAILAFGKAQYQQLPVYDIHKPFE